MKVRYVCIKCEAVYVFKPGQETRKRCELCAGLLMALGRTRRGSG